MQLVETYYSIYVHSVIDEIIQAITYKIKIHMYQLDHLESNSKKYVRHYNYSLVT